MEGVRCISTNLIQASSAHKTENQKIDLTPWDLHFLFVGPIQKGLLFPKPNRSPHTETFTDENTFIRRLRDSFARTLSHFPPLAGRLATTRLDDDDSISFFIDCKNAGALFIHAEANGVTISDILQPLYVPSFVHSLFPLNGMINCDGVFEPLLGVQVTELVDGVFVGCTMNHCVVDGTTFWHFMNYWSEISRASIHLSKPPVFQRSFFDNIDYPIRIPRSSIERFNEEQFIQVQQPLMERVFHFTIETIAKLKANANAEVGTNNISSFQALLAHLWRSIIRNKKLNPNEKVDCVLHIGARPRLRDLPEQYFGNAVKSGIVSMKAKEVEEQRVGEIAREMNKVIAAQSEEEFKRDLESRIASPKPWTLASLINSNVTVISSSPRFDVYGNDFGWGKPIAVRSGSGNKIDGKLTLFCGAEQGSVDIEVCLFLETLEAMAKDDEFMDTVTI